MRVEPVTETELVLAGMWSDVLGVDVVARGDNFFDLGGDSMLATMLVLSARQVWHVEFSVRVLVDAPVLEDLARRIDALVAAGPVLPAGEVPVEEVPVEEVPVEEVPAGEVPTDEPRSFL